MIASAWPAGISRTPSKPLAAMASRLLKKLSALAREPVPRRSKRKSAAADQVKVSRQPTKVGVGEHCDRPSLVIRPIPPGTETAAKLEDWRNHTATSGPVGMPKAGSGKRAPTNTWLISGSGSAGIHQVRFDADFEQHLLLLRRGNHCGMHFARWSRSSTARCRGAQATPFPGAPRGIGAHPRTRPATTLQNFILINAVAT